MPWALSHSATSVPSLSQERKRNPPPGHTITAVPLAFEGSGGKTVSVGCVTLRMSGPPAAMAGSVVVSSFCVQDSEPGAPPGHTGITCCWAQQIVDSESAATRIPQPTTRLANAEHIGFSSRFVKCRFAADFGAPSHRPPPPARASPGSQRNSGRKAADDARGDTRSDYHCSAPGLQKLSWSCYPSSTRHPQL